MSNVRTAGRSSVDAWQCGLSDARDGGVVEARLPDFYCQRRRWQITRVIRCDYGLEVVDTGEDDLVSRVQDHARAAHGTDLPAELILALSRPHRAGGAADRSREAQSDPYPTPMLGPGGRG